MTSRFLLAGAAIALVGAPLAGGPVLAQAGDAAITAARAVIGAWGVDLAGGDPAVRPGDDFFSHAGGKWAATTEIPADRGSVGAFSDLRERTQDQGKMLITSAPAGSKYGALYASYMNEAQVEKVGLAPLLADLAALKAIRTKSQFARLMGDSNGKFGSSVIDIDVGADTANPDLNVLYVGQAGLGMPDRSIIWIPA